jgi:hypothetical protein
MTQIDPWCSSHAAWSTPHLRVQSWASLKNRRLAWSDGLMNTAGRGVWAINLDCQHVRFAGLLCWKHCSLVCCERKTLLDGCWFCW